MSEVPIAVLVVSSGALVLGLLSLGALQGYSQSKLEKILSGDEERLARVNAWLVRDESFQRSLSVFNVLFAVAFTTSALALADAASGTAFLVWGLIVAGTLGLLFHGLVRGVGLSASERLLLRLMPAYRAIDTVIGPLLLPFDALGRLMGRLGGGHHQDEDADGPKGEIIDAIAEGEADGVLAETEAGYLENIIEFGDTVVREVMTPRTDMVCVSDDSSAEEIFIVVTETGHSKLPLYTENRDRIVGVVYLKDLIRRRSELTAGTTVTALARDPLFVPETKKIGDLLQEFQQARTQVAIVLDEFGGTSGLVTVEDILEEIVGELDDEFDKTAAPGIDRIGEHAVEVDAKLPIETVNDELSLNLPEDAAYDTVGGYLAAVLGKVPAKGETFNYNGVRFEVTDADDRKVKRIRVTTG